MPQVKTYQIGDLGIPTQNLKALLLLNNAPAHSSESVLCTQDGNFRCRFLRKNTSSIIQPLDQGIILATKRLYRERFLEEVMVVLEVESEESEGIRRQRTLQNLTNYTLKSTILESAAAWKAVKTKHPKMAEKETFK
jgi:hypothetical protein